MKSKQRLERARSDGQLSNKDYQASLAALIQKDQVLLQHLMAENDDPAI